jgi:hypothetical protein
MATIYPFSIYTSNGQVYPSQGGGGTSLAMDFNWLGWIPNLVNKQLESVNEIVENKTLNLSIWERNKNYYMFPDLTLYDLTDWNTEVIAFNFQRELLFKNNELTIDFSKINKLGGSCFMETDKLHKVTFVGKAKIDQTEEDAQAGIARLDCLFADANFFEIHNLDFSDYTYCVPSSMFRGNNNLGTITNLNLPTPYDSTSSMFSWVIWINELPISSMDMTHVTDASRMFENCGARVFPTLTNMGNLTNIERMFGDCKGRDGEFDPIEHPHHGSIDIEISFASDAIVQEAFSGAYLFHSITINTTNLPRQDAQTLIQMWDVDENYLAWLTQLKVYVPASVLNDWVAIFKAACNGNTDLEDLVENSIVEAIQN